MNIRTGKAVSIQAGLGLSLLINTIVTISGVAIIAVMLKKNAITWERAGYFIMITLLTASFTGGKIAINTVKTQRNMIALMSGVLYWALLLCVTALFFGGQYSSVFETALLIISGSTASALLHKPKNIYISKNRTRSYR